MTALWGRLERMVAEAGAAALVTVVAVRGSAPREPGARMIVAPDGGHAGTIGGGALEWTAIAAAHDQACAGQRGLAIHRLSLGPELAQCCGGHVTLAVEAFAADDLPAIAELARREAARPFVTSAAFVEGQVVARRPAPEAGHAAAAVALTGDGRLIERFGDHRRPVLLFGAGHVGRALVMALAPLPFQVMWVDPRREAFPERAPANVEMRHMERPAEILARAMPSSFVTIMTHSHPLDLEICAAALAPDRFAHVGLIGSATKRARFAGRLRRLGVTEGALNRLACPIGLPELRDKAPAVIAASVAADLLLRKQALDGEEAVDERASEAS